VAKEELLQSGLQSDMCSVSDFMDKYDADQSGELDFPEVS
jgi:hypothetical protein